MAEKNKRNLVIMFLLGFVTLGIYWMYWIYKVTELSNGVRTLPKRSPIGQMLLCIIPFYVIYWYYQTSKRVDVMMESVGRPVDSGVLALLLIFFSGLPIAALVMQDKINTVLELRTGTGVQKNISGALALGIVGIILATATLVGTIVFSFADDVDKDSPAYKAGFDFGYLLFSGELPEDSPYLDDSLNENEAVRQTKDGKWALMDGDKVEKDFTGVAENEHGLWYIENGYVNFDFSGTIEDDTTVYTIEKGKVVDQEPLKK